MKRFSILVTCVMTLALGCHRSDRNEVTNQQLTPYVLEVTIEGLVGFIKDQPASPTKVWALLVDADYDPGTYTTDDLPPCVYDEVQRLNSKDRSRHLATHFPRHFSFLRVPAGEVKDMADSKYGVSIAGKDVTISTGMAGLGTVTLDKLASSAKYAGIKDKINPDFLKLDFKDVPRGLSARVLIDAAKTLEARAVKCGAGYPKYSFRAPGTACTGTGIELGEEVVWRQEGITQATNSTLSD